MFYLFLFSLDWTDTAVSSVAYSWGQKRMIIQEQKLGLTMAASIDRFPLRRGF